jgi:hypothetical protein
VSTESLCEIRRFFDIGYLKRGGTGENVFCSSMTVSPASILMENIDLKYNFHDYSESTSDTWCFLNHFPS